MKKIFFILSFLLCIGAKNYAQNVNIPDANFKAALVGNATINTNGDSEIQVSEAGAFASVIDVHYKGISDLSGIEAFTQISGLDCSSNQLSSLDLSNNIYLKLLNCSFNPLTSLNILNNTVLWELNCYVNQLTSLNISNNIGLTNLYCNHNLLSSLDISNNLVLQILSCSWNQLTFLDISNNTGLKKFYCIGNPYIFCIQVSDTDYANNTWTAVNGNIDPTMYFSLDCSNVSTAENLATSLSILPNPASDYLYISYEGEKKLSFVISDIWGKTLAAWEKTSAGSFYQKEVPIADFSAGIYFLSAQAGDKKVVKKFVKE